MLQRILKKGNGWMNWSMQEWLLISCGFSCLLLCARMIITGYNTYLFMTWNLFLAIIPYIISQWLQRLSRISRSKWKLTFALLLWLSFVPNTFYIITDLFHLETFDAAPKWFDLLLIYSFAWNGLMLGLISVRKAELVLERLFGQGFSLFIIFVVMWLNAFGIYIGRYLRYNSWDIIFQPFSLFGEMWNLVIHPISNWSQWGMIGVYSIFMTVCYVTIKKLSESFSVHQHAKIKPQ